MIKPVQARQMCWKSQNQKSISYKFSERQLIDLAQPPTKPHHPPTRETSAMCLQRCACGATTWRPKRAAFAVVMERGCPLSGQTGTYPTSSYNKADPCQGIRAWNAAGQGRLYPK